MTPNSKKQTYEEIIRKTLETLADKPLSETLREVVDFELGDSANNSTKNEIFARAQEELEGFGPIKHLLDDPGVSEILINSPGQVYFETEGRLILHSEGFTSSLTLMRLIKRFLSEMEKVADTRHPLVDGSLKDGTRVHIALPPVSVEPVISIRRHRFSRWALDELVSRNMLSPSLSEKLQDWIRERKNLLICGATGSGKTTLLRALLMNCAEHERIISLEDTAEIGANGYNQLNLLTRIDAQGLAPDVTLTALLRNALRMRPDRIVVGEVRGEEALTLLDALATGHRGSMCTLHASNAQRALRRLESLVSRAAPRWDIMTIRQLIFDGIDAVIVLENRNGRRLVSQTATLSGIENFGYLLETSCY